MSDLREQYEAVLGQHQRLGSKSCVCGWGFSPDSIDYSHAEHVAGLLLIENQKGTFMHVDDMLREADKVVDALQHAGEHLSKENEANAELHLADKVLYSPLTVAVLNAHDSAVKIRDHLIEQAGR